MTNIKVYGRDLKRVDKLRRIIGNACSLCDLDVIDYVECNKLFNIGYIKADKEVTTPIINDIDFLIILDKKFKNDALEGLKYGSIVIVNSNEKITLKNTKLHICNVNATFDTTILGALTKLFSKISIKNMKAAIEVESKPEKGENDAFDECYKGAK